MPLLLWHNFSNFTLVFSKENFFALKSYQISAFFPSFSFSVFGYEKYLNDRATTQFLKLGQAFQYLPKSSSESKIVCGCSAGICFLNSKSKMPIVDNN